MSYFDGADSDEDKKYGGSDDESDTSSTNSDILGGEAEDDEEQENEEGVEDNEMSEDEEGGEEMSDPDDEQSDMEGGDPEAGEEETEEEAKKAKRVKKIPAKQAPVAIIAKDDDEEYEDVFGEEYLQKFDKEINDNYIVNSHPECVSQNYDEILAMSKVVRDENGIIMDDLHRTIPYLTKFEKARILGQRAKQINSGASPFVKVPESVIDGYVIAEMELKEKRIPFIIRRPLPNGGSEYWSLKDLEDISF